MEAVNLSLVSNRKDLDNQLAIRIDDPTLRAFFNQSVDFSQAIEKKWSLNLSSIKRNLSFIMNFPQLSSKALCKSLFLRGSLSHYVSDANLFDIEKYFANYQLTTIQGASHWIHAEKRDEFNQKVIKFLLD
jgi:pimeloyl-ACP methyl ester carboxylesterase